VLGEAFLSTLRKSINVLISLTITTLCPRARNEVRFIPHIPYNSIMISSSWMFDEIYLLMINKKKNEEFIWALGHPSFCSLHF